MVTSLGFLRILWFLCLTLERNILADQITSPCKVDRTQIKSVIVDCSHGNLQAVPRDLPRDLTTLILSHNEITHLGNQTLSLYPKMNILTLDNNDLTVLDQVWFTGLKSLEHLDLSFNLMTMNYTSFPPGVFQGLDKLLTLKLSSRRQEEVGVGWSSLGKVIGQLTNLQKLTMSIPGPRDNDSPFLLDDEYEKLGALRALIIYGSTCNIGYLNDKSFYPLRNSPLQNLTIRNCHLQSVSPGVFKPLSKLKILNLACNRIGFNNLTAALSKVPHLRLHTLIIDDIQDSAFSLRQEQVCLPALQDLKRYSVRHNSIMQVDVRILECVQNLEYLAFGFNPVISGIPDHWRNLLYALLDNVTLITIDASYTLNLGTSQFYNIYKDPPEMDTEDYIRKPPEFLLPEVYNNETIPLHHHNSSRHHEDFWENVPSTWKVLFLDNIGPNQLFTITDINANTDNHILYINMSSTGAHTLKQPLKGFHRLQMVDLSSSKLSFIQPGALDDMPRLRRLLLGNNRLGLQSDPFKNCFSKLGQLQVLDLSQNSISTLHEDSFASLPNLTHLDLSRNFLPGFNIWLNMSLNLKLLDLRENLIHFLPDVFMEQLETIALGSPLVLDLQNNPLQCGCDSLHFLHWFHFTNVSIPWKESFTCSHDNKTEQLLSLDLDLLAKQCAEHKPLSLILIISLPSVVCLLIVLVTSLFYRYRWHLRWHFYLMRRQLRMRGQGDEFGKLDKYKFRAFVSHHHQADMNWVIKVLMPLAERDWGLRLCVGYRDFMPGIPIVENIVSAIDHSYRTLLIVTPDFVTSEWCDFETNMALTKGRKHVIVCLMKNIPFEDMSATLGALVKLNNYIEWSEDLRGQQLFWDRLRVALTEDEKE